MKKLALIIALGFTTTVLTAQANTVDFHGFNPQSGEYTGEYIAINGENYQVQQTSGGAQYITLNSKRTGNDYPLWIGSPTEEMLNGQPLRETSTGKLFYFSTSKTGNPYNNYVK